MSISLKHALGTWFNRPRILEEFKKPYMQQLSSFLKQRREKVNVYPQEKFVFTAFRFTPFEKVKVVVMSQDPYHTPDVAEGLAFSSGKPDYLPPSLRNIFKEIKQDIGKNRLENVENYSLAFWALQGVFLINTILTVEESSPASHKGKGWEEFNKVVFRELLENRKHIVYMLWGNYAKKFMQDVFKDLPNPEEIKKRNLFLLSAHPSPLSANRGFFGNNHFKKCNEYLNNHGIQEIKW